MCFGPFLDYFCSLEYAIFFAFNFWFTQKKGGIPNLLVIFGIPKKAVVVPFYIQFIEVYI
jgi:hypothetical protein